MVVVFLTGGDASKRLVHDTWKLNETRVARPQIKVPWNTTRPVHHALRGASACDWVLMTQACPLAPLPGCSELDGSLAQLHRDSVRITVTWLFTVTGARPSCQNKKRPLTGLPFFIVVKYILCCFCAPLQYSCLENLMGRGAWRAAVHGITKSQTRLSNYTTTTMLLTIWVCLLLFFFLI